MTFRLPVAYLPMVDYGKACDVCGRGYSIRCKDGIYRCYGCRNSRFRWRVRNQSNKKKER
jgi:hypothetical protein